MGFHYKFSASGSHRWINCPASIKACEGIKSESSVYAEEGTKAHELAENLLLNKPHHPVDSETFEHVKGYVDFVRSHAQGKELRVEHKFILDFLAPDAGGTCDAVIIEPFGTLHVIDLKFGAGVEVEAIENPQLIFYALGAAWNEKLLAFDDYEKILMTIYQPRRNHVETWEVKPDALLEWSALFKEAITAALSPTPEFKEGEWCRWCPALSTCPKITKTAMDLLDSAEINLPVNVISEDKIEKILKAKNQVKSFFDAIESYALGKLLNGGNIPGLKLVETKKRRAWENENDVLEEFISLGYKSTVLGDYKVKSPAQLEKIIKKEHKEKINDLLVKHDTEYKIALEGDSRPQANYSKLNLLT